MNSAITFDQVSKTYDNGVTGLESSSFQIPYNKCIGVIGVNGAGKTTLIHLIAGILHPTTGTIKRIMRNPNDIAWVSQTQTVDWYLSVTDNVRFGARLGGASIKESLTIAEEILVEIGLKKKQSMLPDQLSGGEIRRVQIGRALAQRSKILLLDEPTVGLDPIASQKLIEKISKMVSSDTLVLISSHDLHILDCAVDDVLYLHDGKIEAYTSREEFLNSFSSNSLREAFFSAHA